MEGVGIAANLMGIIDTSSKIIGICAKYAQDVKSANDDRARLSQEVVRLHLALCEAKDLLTGPKGASLRHSKSLNQAISDSEDELRHLGRLLPFPMRNPGGGSYLDNLKWPFKSKELDTVVRSLQRCSAAVNMALQVDQTATILSIDERAALDQLPFVGGASFDSHEEEHNATCLPNTRVDLLRDIARWMDDQSSTTIFWLSGMAGTGKSTISRTLAHSRRERGDLGATFFFKRGESDRSNLKKFMTTLARQMAQSVPGLAAHVKDAVDANPTISSKAVSDQLHQLIMSPLSNVAGDRQSPLSLVIIIDALDECEQEHDARLLIQLFSRAKSPEHLRLRILITSRPELPIRLGFKNAKGTYRDFTLQQVPQPIIHHDITVFLKHELGRIREEFNGDEEEQQKLSSDWPGSESLQSLVTMAGHLFIFATTMCRLIEDRTSGKTPKRLLEEILDQKDTSQASKLHLTYSPALSQQFVGLLEYEQFDRTKVVEDFRLIVGAIVTLVSPLSPLSLSQILDIPLDMVTGRLRFLHSVLMVPPSSDLPVRLLHLSFRDYLVDSRLKDVNKFWIDETLAHHNLAEKCIRIMRSHLRQDICNLHDPGLPGSAVDDQTIKRSIPPELQYACLYWVHHRVESRISRQEDIIKTYDFLMDHSLHWFEVMGLTGSFAECLDMLRQLDDWVQDKGYAPLLALIVDAIRFLQTNGTAISETPLQTYCSALLFSPKKSIIKNRFADQIPKWIDVRPQVNDDWDACLAVLEGHRGLVCAALFSRDAKTVVSQADDLMGIWDVNTGACKRMIECSSPRSTALSYDSRFVAGISEDNTLRIWSLITGGCEKTLGEAAKYIQVAFSYDSKVVASASRDNTIRIWNVGTGICERTLEGHKGRVRSIVFSHDSKLMASTSTDATNETIRIWSMYTGKCKRIIKAPGILRRSIVFPRGSQAEVLAFVDLTLFSWSIDTENWREVLRSHGEFYQSAFSHNTKSMALGLDKTLQIWSIDTGECTHNLLGHTEEITYVAFSHDSKLLASASYDRTIRIWNTKTGECEDMLHGHGGVVVSVEFSHDSKMIVSASWDRTIRIWNVGQGRQGRSQEGPRTQPDLITISPDLTKIASASSAVSGGMIQISIVDTGEDRIIEEIGGGSKVRSMVFSHDSALLVSALSNNTIQIWSAETGACKQVLMDRSRWPTDHSYRFGHLAISLGSLTIALVTSDNDLQLWNIERGECDYVLGGHEERYYMYPSSLGFSCDSQMLVSASADRTTRIWNISTGKCTHILKGHGYSARSVAFSADSAIVASASYDNTIRIWSVSTGECKHILHLEHSEQTPELHFDVRKRCLVTHVGAIPLEYISDMSLNTPKDSQMSAISTWDSIYDVHTEDWTSWVTWRGRRLLKLPAECREGKTATSGSSVVISCKTGRVVHLSFSATELERQLASIHQGSASIKP